MWEAFLLGLVQGLTEFLPISSTGHLLLVAHALGIERPTAFWVVVQVGPILAAAWVYRQRLVTLAKSQQDSTARGDLLRLLVAVGVTMVGGFVLKLTGWELTEEVRPVAWALLIGALVMFAGEWRLRGREGAPSISWTAAVIIGLAQVVAAMFPGTSRSGACIMAALLLGVARPAAVEFSFLVGIPAMLAAASVEVLEVALQGTLVTLLTFESLLACVVATVSAWATVVFLLRWVRTGTFVPFAIYRTLLGLTLLIFVT